MSKIEVERKYKIERGDVDEIVLRLFGWLFTATPLLQEDRFLEGAKGLKERVRREESGSKVIYLNTQKRKIRQKNCPNTNLEDEREIDLAQHKALVSQRQASAHGCQLIVRKAPRIDFRGKFLGNDVSVCIDRVEGPDDIRFGYFVELEVLVDNESEIPQAQKMLKALRRKLLPHSAKRELRGYRSMLLEELQKRAEQKDGKELGKMN